MRFEIRAFALTGGLTAAVLFIVCASAVAVAPEATTAFAGSLIHADLSGIMRSLTWGNFILGLVVWTGGTAGVFAFVAVGYNRLVLAAPSGR
jgi:hypothetical protein